jgi:hypothetical protein
MGRDNAKIERYIMAEITNSTRKTADDRRLIKLVHPVAGGLALLTIATFWLSTALSELFASEATVAAVKTAIPWGFLLLIPALAAAGGSGFALAKGRQAVLIGAKIRRMPWIAANGILILIPAALFLAYKARAAEFDTVFYAVQPQAVLEREQRRIGRTGRVRRPIPGRLRLIRTHLSSGLAFLSSVQAIAGTRHLSPSIRFRIFRNRSRGTATSAIWGLT